MEPESVRRSPFDAARLRRTLGVTVFALLVTVFSQWVDCAIDLADDRSVSQMFRDAIPVAVTTLVCQVVGWLIEGTRLDPRNRPRKPGPVRVIEPRSSTPQDLGTPGRRFLT